MENFWTCFPPDARRMPFCGPCKKAVLQIQEAKKAAAERMLKKAEADGDAEAAALAAKMKAEAEAAAAAERKRLEEEAAAKAAREAAEKAARERAAAEKAADIYGCVAHLLDLSWFSG